MDRTHLEGTAGLFQGAPSDRQPEHRRICTAIRWCAKLAIKPDSPFYDWLERELAIASMLPVARRKSSSGARHAPSRAQARSRHPAERHEKDDRHRLDDRSRYVLGWTNAAKIAALEVKARQLETRLAELGSHIEQGCKAEQKELQGKLDGNSVEAGGVPRLSRARLASACH